jgi:hypothetical protein
MAADAFVSLLNEQIAHEYAAHQQYVACAVYYDVETLPQLARFFYASVPASPRRWWPLRTSSRPSLWRSIRSAG